MNLGKITKIGSNSREKYLDKYTEVDNNFNVALRDRKESRQIIQAQYWYNDSNLSL